MGQEAIAIAISQSSARRAGRPRNAITDRDEERRSLCHPANSAGAIGSGGYTIAPVTSYL